MTIPDEYRIADLAALTALYGEPRASARIKETPALQPAQRAFIKAAPFLVLATAGPDGLDISPRGDAPGFVEVQDDKTLLLPDRRGNNRVDSLRNIIADPRVALLFLIPGITQALRVNGEARISVEPALLERFSAAGQAPRSVLVIGVQTVFFQHSRAIRHARLWDADAQRLHDAPRGDGAATDWIE